MYRKSKMDIIRKLEVGIKKDKNICKNIQKKENTEKENKSDQSRI